MVPDVETVYQLEQYLAHSKSSINVFKSEWMNEWTKESVNYQQTGY